MKSRLQVFSTTKMVAQHTSVLILVLSCALYNIMVDGEDTCVPVNTPWTGMCKARCWVRKIVTLLDCSQTSLPTGSYSGGDNSTDVFFENSGIANVSRRAFSGYTVNALYLIETFVQFEPEAFSDLTVGKLDIYQNLELTSLPSGVFRGVTELVQLFIRYNGLQSLPQDIFHGLTDLVMLDLSENKLQSLPAGIFRGLTGLEALHLSYNNLESLHADTFQGLTGLQVLFLSDNSLKSLHADTFHGLTGLQELDLINNNLESLHADTFQGLTGLQGLLLSDNSLKSLHDDTFHGLGNVTRLYLSRNTISCFGHALFQPLHSVKDLKINQKVDIRGLCPRTIRGLGPEVKDYNVKIDDCIVECETSVKGFEVIDSNNACDCDSYEGCLDCSTGHAVTLPSVTDMEKPNDVITTVMTADKKVTDMEKPSDVITAVMTADNLGADLDKLTPTKQPSPTAGGAMKAAVTGTIMLMLYPVMIMIREF